MQLPPDERRKAVKDMVEISPKIMRYGGYVCPCCGQAYSIKTSHFLGDAGAGRSPRNGAKHFRNEAPYVWQVLNGAYTGRGAEREMLQHVITGGEQAVEEQQDIRAGNGDEGWFAPSYPDAIYVMRLTAAVLRHLCARQPAVEGIFVGDRSVSLPALALHLRQVRSSMTDNVAANLVWTRFVDYTGHTLVDAGVSLIIANQSGSGDAEGAPARFGHAVFEYVAD